MDPKFIAAAGLVRDKALMTAAMLREMIKDTLCIRMR
jgi:hypothetical protein